METLDGQRDPYEEILRRIRTGRYATGTRLPSERALSDEFGIHRTTLQRALTRLVAEGLIERERGCRPIVRGSLPAEPQAAEMRSPASRTRTVALIANAGFPFVDNSTGALMLGAQATLRENGCRLLFLSTSGASIEERRQTEREDLESLLDDPTDGLIIVPQDTRSTCSPMRALAERGTAIVVADRPIEDVNLDYVAVDNETGSTLATEHLLGLGHTRLAFVDSREERYRPADERRQTFLRTLMSHGLSVTTDTVLDLPVTYDTARIAASLREWLKRRPLPTGLVCLHDSLAFHVARALTGLGYSIPGDVSLVGYDDDARYRFLDPGVELTTVRQPLFDLGQDAAALLIHRLERPQTPVRSVRLSPELVVRTSTRAA